MSRWNAKGERIPTTLFELAAYHCSLRVRCRRCPHEAVFHGAALWWLFQRKHWPDELRDVPGKLSCTICGNREVKLEVVRAPPTITHLPLPCDADWKRAVSRYRA